MIIGSFRLAERGYLPLPEIWLKDSLDMMNKVYNSSRSPLRYCYMRTTETQLINSRGIKNLSALTVMNWAGNINEVCFPIFEYQEGGFIDAHRGRDVGYGRNDYVAVLMLTDYGKDFTGGEFYLNKKADASEDGKTVTNDHEVDRIYFKQPKGSLLIFNNNIHVHGTTPVRTGRANKTIRMTTSWRMQA